MKASEEPDSPRTEPRAERFLTLPQLAKALRDAVGDPILFSTVATRVVLRTGVDLCSQDQQGGAIPESEAIKLAVQAIEDMSIAL
ncbi:MAG: hypothetical protein AAF355_03660 [Myxococcota bacterium]